jgi:hypothetical protein
MVQVGTQQKKKKAFNFSFHIFNNHIWLNPTYG